MDEPRAVVADQLFEGMAESVAEIEQGAVALLGLVARDDRGLGFAAHRNGVVKLGSARKNAGQWVSSQAKKSGRVDQAVFGDLGVAGANSRGGKVVRLSVSARTSDGW